MRIVFGKPKKTILLCPRCKEKARPLGRFLHEVGSIDFRKQIFFFKVTIRINIEIQYCANCGYLQVYIWEG